jgi:hypothetical protein
MKIEIKKEKSFDILGYLLELILKKNLANLDRFFHGKSFV